LRNEKVQYEIKPDKCEFLWKKVSYLGHVMGQDCVRPDEKRIKAVKEYPRRKTTRELKGSLGLAGYYWRFIPNFSKVAKPLTELLKKTPLCMK